MFTVLLPAQMGCDSLMAFLITGRVCGYLLIKLFLKRLLRVVEIIPFGVMIVYCLFQMGAGVVS